MTKGAAKESVALKCNQAQSSAIRCNQAQSSAIKRKQVQSGAQSSAIKRKQVQSGAIDVTCDRRATEETANCLELCPPRRVEIALALTPCVHGRHDGSRRWRRGRSRRRGHWRRRGDWRRSGLHGERIGAHAEKGTHALRTGPCPRRYSWHSWCSQGRRHDAKGIR